jgi:hypothetical protein
MIKTLIQGMGFISEHKIITSELKQRAIDEYKSALKMPRKKKKIAKKSALSLYSIACWGEEKLYI